MLAYRHAITVAILLLVLAGCTVGPNYKVPQPAMPAAFSEHAVPATTTNSAMASPDAWWTVFQDATLNELMQEAVHSGPDLAIADARVREARALRRIAVADRFPIVDAGGFYNRNHGSLNVPIGVPPGGMGPNETSDLWQAGFDASWEIDIFGGIRRNVESANASYQAEIESGHDVALSLFAEIARNYIELRSLQRQLAIVRDNLSVQRTLLSLTQSRFNAGLSSSQDVSEAQSDASAVEAQLAPLVTDERAAIYRIGALVGRKPEDLLVELDQPQSVQTTASPDVPVGLPSDLLLRRPDIRVAESRLAAATARIGVAKADLYPHFYLTSLAGLESLNFGSFFNAASGYYSVGPDITWKVFDAGKVRSEVLTERARTDQAAAEYQKTVLDALKEVEIALVAYAQAQMHRQSLAVEIAADQKTLQLSQQLYHQGVQDYFAVLEAEKVLDLAEFELAEGDRDTAINLIALYKSLGGGWKMADHKLVDSQE